MDAYTKFSDEKSLIIKEDACYYQNLLDNAIAADKSNVVYSLATDLNWLDNNIKACKNLMILSAELQKCYDYLKQKNDSYMVITFIP